MTHFWHHYDGTKLARNILFYIVFFSVLAYVVIEWKILAMIWLIHSYYLSFHHTTQISITVIMSAMYKSPATYRAQFHNYRHSSWVTPLEPIRKCPRSVVVAVNLFRYVCFIKQPKVIMTLSVYLLSHTRIRLHR